MATKEIKQAVILSAGLGTRLRPMTDNLPKVMVPIAGKPLLQHHLERFRDNGIKEFFINLHYLPEKIPAYFGDGSKFGVNIHYWKENLILGTAGGVKNFEPDLGDNFFVMYGDIFSLVNYEKMSLHYQTLLKPMAMEVISDTDHPYDSDLVELDKRERVLKIWNKPQATLPRNYKGMRGIFIFNKQILEFIPQNTYYEIDRDLLPQVVRDGHAFYAYQTDDFLEDIGTLERYQRVKELYESGGFV